VETHEDGIIRRFDIRLSLEGNCRHHMTARTPVMAEIATQVLPLQKAPFCPANQKSKVILSTPMAEIPAPADVVSSDDYATGSGIFKTLADAVRTEILERTVKQITGGTSKETDITRSNAPITFITHGNHTRAASNAYLTVRTPPSP